MSKLHKIKILSTFDSGKVEDNKISLDSHDYMKSAFETMAEISKECPNDHKDYEFLKKVVNQIDKIEALIHESPSYHSEDQFNSRDGHSTTDTLFIAHTLELTVAIRDPDESMDTNRLKAVGEEIIEFALSSTSDNNLTVKSMDVDPKKKSESKYKVG